MFRLLPKVKPVLGRWEIPSSTKLLHRKIDLANEDHCGCCEPEKPKETTMMIIQGYDDVVFLPDDFFLTENK